MGSWPHQSRGGEVHDERVEHVGVQRSADLEDASTLGARANLQAQGATEETISIASTTAVLAKAEPQHVGSVGSHEKAGPGELAGDRGKPTESKKTKRDERTRAIRTNAASKVSAGYRGNPCLASGSFE